VVIQNYYKACEFGQFEAVRELKEAVSLFKEGFLLGGEWV
jgi:hypothetical protein